MSAGFDAAATPGADQPDRAAADDTERPPTEESTVAGAIGGDEILDFAAPGVSAEVAPAADAAPGEGDELRQASPGAAEGSEARPTGEVSVEDLLDDLDRVTGERDTHLADLQRVSAEFANFRRQTEKRVGDLVHRAVSRLVGELLPVLDACDAALEHGVEGIEPVKAALLGVLEREGLEVIGKPGEPFDPTRHEAVAHEPDGGEQGPTVIEVLRAGYALNGRVVRPAMVKVRG